MCIELFSFFFVYIWAVAVCCPNGQLISAQMGNLKFAQMLHIAGGVFGQIKNIYTMVMFILVFHFVFNDVCKYLFFYFFRSSFVSSFNCSRIRMCSRAWISCRMGSRLSDLLSIILYCI